MGENDTYELYIGNKTYSSWSLRPWVLMKELDIPFKETLVPFTPDRHERYLKFSPSGKVPTLDDHGTIVWDSLAITEYLAERYGRVWPLDPEARAFARCAAAEMHSGFSGLRNACSMVVGIRVELNEIGPALAADLERITALWTEGLSRFGGPFLAGKRFTAADAFFCPVAFRAQTYGILNEGVAGDYVRQLLALPAMQEWSRAALAETWRWPSGEDDAHKAGKIIADLRALPA
ncbi:MAG TPA: glutathione S-transferase family protein [Devosiaceae bacterium]|jgi:glutathione S-transferase|nr:glutathione S-transferase family protein [Devosiaceae bacterium]